MKLTPIYFTNLIDPDAEKQKAKQNAVENYKREFGREPATIDEAVEWQREECARLEREYKAAQAAENAAVYIDPDNTPEIRYKIDKDVTEATIFARNETEAARLKVELKRRCGAELKGGGGFEVQR